MPDLDQPNFITSDDLLKLKSQPNFLKLKRECYRQYHIALKQGILKRPQICSRCKKSKSRQIDGHHKNYNKPLDVDWLCQNCHGKITIQPFIDAHWKEVEKFQKGYKVWLEQQHLENPIKL